MAQYRNVLSWLEKEYLTPAIGITKKVVNEAEEKDPEPTEYKELKELEDILEKALEYVKEHSK